MTIVQNQKPRHRKLLIFRLKLNIHILIEDMTHKAMVEEGMATVEEQDLVVELIITVTRTMDNHVKTDLVRIVSLQNVLSVNPYFIMLEADNKKPAFQEHAVQNFTKEIEQCFLEQIVSEGDFYLAQSIGDMATSVRNGDMVGNGNINFVTPLS